MSKVPQAKESLVGAELVHDKAIASDSAANEIDEHKNVQNIFANIKRSGNGRQHHNCNNCNHMKFF